MGNQVSDTTLRARRNEWVARGVFEAVASEVLVAYDRGDRLRLLGVCG